MGSGLGLTVWLMVVVAVVNGAAAKIHIVGDGLGWTVPPGGPLTYAIWASKQDFKVGDIIVFWWNGTHDVARVSKADFERCTTEKTIGPIQTTSPAIFTLEDTSTHYFTCTVDLHCFLGRKVAITARETTALPSAATSAAA